MEASFVIPLYNCLELTQAGLRSLRATLPAGLEHEIILVDDGSTDGTRGWLRDQASSTGPVDGPPVRVLLNERNLGFAAACNRGAATAQGEFLFLLNNDLVFLPGWFGPMRAVFARRADTGLVGNVQLAAATGAVDHAGLFFDRLGKPVHDTARPWWARLAGLRPVPAVTGACLAIRRRDWRAFGGFDEGYVNGGEDVDLCLRALDAGRRNYVALRSVVRHHVSRSPGRKRHDEENSRRLTVCWRHLIATLAAPDWSRHYLDREWQGPRDPGDFAVACAAWASSLGWRRHPSIPVARGVQLAVEVELARWRTLLDGAPPAEPSPASEPLVL